MDHADDWLFDSVKRYRNLSMYDLQQSMSAMDWVDNGNGVCVATSDGVKHELLELTLPDKMLDETQGNLKKDRDFRVETGAMCKRKMTCVKHLPTSRFCVVAEENSPTVTLWEMGTSDTDLMQEVQPLPAPPMLNQPIRMEEGSSQAPPTTHQPIKMCVHMTEGHEGCIGYGANVNDIVIVDVATFTKMADTSGCPLRCPVSTLDLASSQLTCCTTSGDLVILDTRRKNPLVNHRENTGKAASYWTMVKDTDQSNSLLQLSSSGQIVNIDTRCLDSVVSTSDTGLAVGEIHKEEYLTIQSSPDHNYISVSGFDGMIHLFQTSDLSKESLQPVFCHEGHVMECENQSEAIVVIQHMWHPWQRDLILSGATDGSLHAWQYNAEETRKEMG